ncbi:MAG: XisI protein [Chloroflexi bacterium]|nr:MAG: XisI protein [Chloroflexota bacterium]
MDNRMNYPTIVKKLLQEYADYYSIEGENPLRPLFDDTNQSFLLLDTNWIGSEYVHHTPIHVDIINNKIWIQYDDTEEGFATDLLEAGVPAHDIVLGFRPPQLRVHTEFAVA